MKLSHKLLLVILLIITGTAVLGLASIGNIRTIQRFADAASEVTMPSVIASGRLAAMFADFRTIEMQFVLAPETMTRQDFDARSQKIFEGFKSSTKMFLESSPHPEEMESWRVFSAANDEYNRLYPRIMQLVEEGKRDEAERLLLTESRKAYERAMDALQRLSQLNEGMPCRIRRSWGLPSTRPE